jgi:formyl-CoA transferase
MINKRGWWSRGLPILISIQNEREWASLCRRVLERPDMIVDPKFATNPARIANRPEMDGIVAAAFKTKPVAELERQLAEADIAFARVNDTHAVLRHPHLRRVTVGSIAGPITLPAPPARFAGEEPVEFGDLPALGAHTAAVRAEFLGDA